MGWPFTFGNTSASSENNPKKNIRITLYSSTSVSVAVRSNMVRIIFSYPSMPKADCNNWEQVVCRAEATCDIMNR